MISQRLPALRQGRLVFSIDGSIDGGGADGAGSDDDDEA